MESRSHALMAGLFTLCLIILTALFALWLGKDSVARTPYIIATRLSVAGLNLQAVVRYKGIKVGKVTDIDFDEKNPGQILFKLEILSETPITNASYATLAYQGVTGIAYVELNEDINPAVTPKRSAAMSEIPLRPGLIQNLEQRGMAILGQTEELTKRMNSMLDPTNRQSIMNSIAQIGRAAQAWEAIPAKLDPVINSLPELIAQTQSSASAFKTFSSNATQTSKNFTALAERLQAQDGSIAKLNLALDQISNGITFETLPSINALTNEAKTTMKSVNRATESLHSQPQSILFGHTPPPPGPGEVGFVAPNFVPK